MVFSCFIHLNVIKLKMKPALEILVRIYAISEDSDEQSRQSLPCIQGLKAALQAYEYATCADPEGEWGSGPLPPEKSQKYRVS